MSAILTSFYDLIDSVMRNRDDFRGRVDYKGDLVPAWGRTATRRAVIGSISSCILG